MTITTYDIDQFVNDMKELQAKGLDDSKILDSGSSYLEKLISNPDCIPPEYRVPSLKGNSRLHGSYLLHRSDDLLVSAEVWGPGDHVDPHDHRVWGMIGVLENTLNEIRFQWHEDEARPGFGRLEKSRDAVSKPGEVSLLVPGIDEIHQIDNPDSRPTVEIHVYGLDLGTIQRCRYDAATGAKVDFRIKSKYDNE